MKNVHLSSIEGALSNVADRFQRAFRDQVSRDVRWKVHDFVRWPVVKTARDGVERQVRLALVTKKYNES